MSEALGRIQAAAKRTGGYSRSVLADDLREVVARVAELEASIEILTGGLLEATDKLTKVSALRARVAKLEDAGENVIIAFSMGWDMDGVIEVLCAALSLGGLPMENWSVHPESTTKAYVDENLADHHAGGADLR